MGCHTWFFRPIKEGEVPEDTCEYSDVTFGDDRYTDIDTPHDLFRAAYHEGVYLLSLEETLKFVEDNKDEICSYFYNEVTKKDWKDLLTDFWNKNPDGVIEFG
jgi:hypothetical protein